MSGLALWLVATGVVALTITGLAAFALWCGEKGWWLR